MHCVISHHFISDNYCVTLTIITIIFTIITIITIVSHSPFTVSIFQLQVLKDATVLPVTAHQVPEQTNKYTNTKNTNTQNIRKYEICPSQQIYKRKLLDISNNLALFLEGFLVLKQKS